MQNVMLLFAHLGDNELILKINSGNKACFEVLVRKYGQQLFRIGKMYGFGDADVEDLIHDTHLTAFTRLKSFDSRTGYRVWVTGIMIGKCREKLESQNHRYELSNDFVGPVGYHPGQFSLDTAPRENYFVAVASKDHLEALPVEARCAYVLHEVQGFSIRETAGFLKQSEPDVKLHVKSAKSLLINKKRSYSTEIYPMSATRSEHVVRRVMNRV